MHSRSLSRWCWIIVAGAAVACGGGESISPSNNPPANIEAVSNLSTAGTVGATVSSGIVVKISDASGRPVQGVNVAFAVTLGNGSTNPRLAVTDAKGQATSTWTLGTIVGSNEVTASVNGVSTQIKFQATGSAGAVSTIALASQNVRLLSGVDTARISAKALDLFGNSASASPAFVVRDPTLVSVDPAGLVRALRRGSSTYVVATAGAKSDSVLVTVLAPGQSLCTNAAVPLDLAVGQVVTDVSGAGVCVHASTPNAEYALVPFYNAAISSATTQIEVRPQGITPLPLSSMADFRRSVAIQPEPLMVPDYARESRMRAQERTESAPRLAAAREWLGARRTRIGGAAQVAVPAVGDLLKLNGDASHFCDQPTVMRTGRVMAVTDKAIVVADTANPAGGFTQDQYKSIGVTFDTLIDPVDRKNFGDPSDIDNNGHVMLFFTRAVNELTDRNASSIYLGFFYQRDLFPKVDVAGNCPGSNVGEMFYLVVPDTGGLVSKRLSAGQVTTFTLGTVAHEYQHLINASRRMYVNKFGSTLEEKWLDEGLAHIAEDIHFWKSSGFPRRSNFDVSAFSDPKIVSAYSTFQQFNVSRYTRYLGRPELQSPIGFDAFDDDLETRGAIWSFLRYSADRLALPDESAFWFKLVNTNATGLPNLAAALGVTPGAWLRDWAISVFMDDNATGVDPRYQQPSLNMRSIISGGGLTYPLVTHLLTDQTTSPLTLTGNGVSFLRFSVANGQEALLTVTSSGQPLPSTVQLAVVRVR